MVILVGLALICMCGFIGSGRMATYFEKRKDEGKRGIL